MRKIKVVVLLVRQLQHGFTKNAKVSPNLTVALVGSTLDSHFVRPGAINRNNTVDNNSKMDVNKCNYF